MVNNRKEKNIAFLHNFHIGVIAVLIFIGCLSFAGFFMYLLYDCSFTPTSNLYFLNSTGSYQPAPLCSTYIGNIGAGAIVFSGMILFMAVIIVLIIIGLALPQDFYNNRSIS
jgi:uncharacterized membrane protein